MFRTARRRDRVGGRQPGLVGPQEPAALRDRRRRGDAGLRPGAARRRSGSGGAGRRRSSTRDPAHLHPSAAAYVIAAARASAGLPGLLRRLRRRHLRAIAAGRPTPSTACRRSPTARGPPRSPTPCCGRPSATAGWTSIRRRRSHEGGRVMKLGFLTACLPKRTLPRSARGPRRTASRRSRWRPGPTSATGRSRRPTSPSTASARATPTRRARCSPSTASSCSSIAYYDNNLHPDPDERAAINAHVHRCIDAAALLGCPTVGTFVGRDPTRSVAENLREAEEVFAPLVDHAGEAGVKLIIENCVMEGWHPDGYPATSPTRPSCGSGCSRSGSTSTTTRRTCCGWASTRSRRSGPTSTASRTPRPRTSSSTPRPATGTAGRAGPSRATTRGTSAGGATGCPGLGQVDWARLVDALYEGGFDGVLSVEHEDPVWGGTEEKVEIGLRIAHRTLRPLMVA